MTTNGEPIRPEAAAAHPGNTPAEPEEFDVVVVGGGPAGSGVAGLLQRDGHRVLLLEREKFPRYHIGESLITGIWPTIDRLGLREKLENAGFQRKYGGTLLWGKDLEPWRFAFRDSGPQEYVFQVRRADFDALLLDHVRQLGVRVVENATVREPVFDGERMAGVHYQVRTEPRPRAARARMVIDASGQQRWLGRHFDMVDWHEDLRNIAVWSYYQDCGRDAAPYEGNIVIENRPDGWLWFIPFSNGTTGIGYVTPTAAMAASGLAPETMLDTQIEQSEKVRELTRQARRVDSYRTARDWSYTCDRFSGPGWALVGDAAAFIDPLLSTGVTLALRGASTLARAVHEALTDPARERGALREYEDSYRDFLGSLLGFVRFFYDQTKSRADYHEEAQGVVDPLREYPAHVDFVTLVSGLARGDEIIEAAPAAASEGSST